MKYSIIRKSFILVTLAVIAFIFLLFCSSTTSPLWDLNYTQDSHVFYIIGKYWSEGQLPYVGLWDQKGPLIYLINLCGYLLTHSLTGVFLIQFLFMTVTLVFMFRLYRVSLNIWQALLGICITLLCLLNIFDNGNLTEEYLLPWLMASFYLQYTWIGKCLEKKDILHPYTGALLYGMTFAFCLLSRLTNALGLCGGVVLIAVILLKQNKYKNLLSNAGAFILGFSILFIPVAWYFYAHDALGEMWYATFSYNLSYASHSKYGLAGGTFFRTYIDAYICILTGLFLMLLHKRRRLVGVWMISISILVLAWLVNSHGFGHYGIICVPYSCFVFLEAYMIYKEKPHKMLPAVMTIFLAVYALMVSSKDIVSIKALANQSESERAAKDCIEMLMDKVPQADYESVAAYDEMPYAFLKYDIKPCYKYFSVHTFTMSMSEEHTQRVLVQFETLKAKWILVDNKNAAYYILPILQKYYKKIDSCRNHELYKLDEDISLKTIETTLGDF